MKLGCGEFVKSVSWEVVLCSHCSMAPTNQHSHLIREKVLQNLVQISLEGANK